MNSDSKKRASSSSPSRATPPKLSNRSNSPITSPANPGFNRSSSERIMAEHDDLTNSLKKAADGDAKGHKTDSPVVDDHTDGQEGNGVAAVAATTHG